MTAAMAIALGLHALARAHLDIVKEPPPFREYAPVVFVAVPWFLLLIAKLDLHRTFERVWSVPELVVDIVKLHALGLVSTAAAVFVMNVVINRSLVGLFLASTFVLLLAERLVLLRWRRFQHETGQGRTRLLLVGDGTRDLAGFAQARGREALPPEVIGYLGEPSDAAALPPRLGTIADLDAVLHQHAVDLVLFFPPWTNPRDAVGALSACEALGTPAAFAIELVQPAAAPPRLLEIYERPFVSFEVAAKSPVSLAVKHALDVVAAALLLILLAVPLLAIAAGIALTMGRPVLFGQERAGLYGRRFRMWKFRTMVRNAESMRDGLLAGNIMSGPVFKLARDPRVTRLGRLLRRTSLDELPQLFNVLTGSMSLVGPRPLPVAEQEQIRGTQRRRLSMKPGITGLWQVAGRNLVDFDDWMKLELRYIDEWSLALDLTILLRTVPAVLSSRGAR
jgi:exopolysaccharide biosynthesis polyprenyl glycosylphosphotransferase